MKRALQGMAVAAAMATAPAAAAQGTLPAAARELQAGVQALGAGDTAAYFAAAVAASRMVPPHPILYYHVARAAVLTGQDELALTTLAQIAPLGAPRDPGADSSFRRLWGTHEFEARVADIARASASIVASDTAFLADVPNLVAENVTFDPVDRAFFIGSMARRTIFRADSTGRSTALLGADEAIGRPTGMRVDTAGRTLWAATFYPPDSSAGHLLQRSELLEINLPDGVVRRRYTPPHDGRAHLLNDIVIAGDGSIFITDSDASAVWRLDTKRDSLMLWIQFDSSIVYPNGIALSPDDRTFYVAHQTGIVAIDRGTRRIAMLAAPVNATIMGIDGLYSTDEGLVGIQNTLPVAQVIAIRVTHGQPGSGVACVTPLERRHPAYVVPTTGVVVGDQLYYVANSELRRLDDSGALADPESQRLTIILRLPLTFRADCPTPLPT